MTDQRVTMALQVGYFFRILFCVYGVPLHPNSWIAPDLRSKHGKIKYVASIGSFWIAYYFRHSNIFKCTKYIHCNQAENCISN